MYLSTQTHTQTYTVQTSKADLVRVNAVNHPPYVDEEKKSGTMNSTVQ